MDIFTEQLAKKPLRKVDYILFFAVIAFIILEVLLSAFVLNFGIFSFFIVAISIYFGIKLIISRSVEFEYVVTNGNVTIDKVIARKSRKNVVSFEMPDVYEFFKCKKDVKLPKLGKIYDLQTTGEAWGACFSDSKFGKVGVIFSPNEKTLKAIKPFLKRQVAIDAFGRN